MYRQRMECREKKKEYRLRMKWSESTSQERRLRDTRKGVREENFTGKEGEMKKNEENK